MTRLTVVYFLLIAGLSAACGANPAAIAEEFQTAINEQDIELALGLMADDIVLQVGTQTITGKAEARDWLETQAEMDFEFEGEPAATDTGVNFENCIIRSEIWSYFRLDEITGSCVLDLDGGSITGFLVQFDEDSTTRLDASPALRSTDLLSIWTSQTLVPELARDDDDLIEGHSGLLFSFYYLQFNEGGNGRLARTPEDLLIPPDAEHTGAGLVWAYDGYVLTIQNKGAASAGYCLEEDVGTFLVRKDGDGGIQFKLIEDTCSWRKFALGGTGAFWESYIP